MGLLVHRCPHTLCWHGGPTLPAACSLSAKRLSLSSATEAFASGTALVGSRAAAFWYSSRAPWKLEAL